MELGLRRRAQAEGRMSVRVPCRHHVAPVVSVALILVAARPLQHRRAKVVVHDSRLSRCLARTRGEQQEEEGGRERGDDRGGFAEASELSRQPHMCSLSSGFGRGIDDGWGCDDGLPGEAENDVVS